MRIEHIDKDEVVVKDETKRIFNKKRFLLSFHDGTSHAVFDPEENTYKIILSRNNKPKKPDDLMLCYDLVHEVHHFQEAHLYPQWWAIRVFDLRPEAYETSVDEYLVEQLSNDIKNRLMHLSKETYEKIMDSFLNAIGHFIRHVGSIPLPRPLAFLNAFEDLKIEYHMKFFHPEVKKSANYSSGTLDNFTKSFSELKKIIKELTGGFSLVFQLPFTSYDELCNIYQWYDLKVILKNRINPEDYYKSYYSGLKKFKKESIPRKAYADRYRANLELKRIKSILRELKK